ncbi:MAG TPA: exodeoxyribonuclease VII small subunit [Candidatus Saccharimonadales bacterium]|nr:exodeoxyribonuclease VII small subunit [Candidatus Saccharimonadales bacterium]
MAKAKTTTSYEASYEALREELDAILDELQREDLPVDTALAHYKRGLELVQQLEKYLKTAENTVTELKSKFDSAA